MKTPSGSKNFEFSLTADSPELAALSSASHGDPFAILGRHAIGESEVVRCFLPRTRQAWLEDESRPLQRLPGTDLFEFRAAAGDIPRHYRVIREDEHGSRHVASDPYSFWPQLSAEEMDSFHAGNHRYAQNLLGARHHRVDEVEGTLFAVWAPNAERVSVIGDFNEWDGRTHPMRRHAGQGIWELFVPGWTGGPYKFEIRNASTGNLHVRSDPFARFSEYRPGTASLVQGPPRHAWNDREWEQRKDQGGWHARPMSVYEVHAGSWRRNEDGSFMGYRRMAEELGDAIWQAYPFVEGVEPMAGDNLERLLNRTWRPALSCTGVGGMPELDSAGNVLRPYTALKLSMRLPPTVDELRAFEAALSEAADAEAVHATVVDRLLVAGLQRRLHDRILIAAWRIVQHPEAGKHEGHRSSLTQITASLGKRMTHLAHRAISVIGQTIDNNRGTGRAITFITNLFIIGAIKFTGTSLDRTFDDILGYRLTFRLVHGAAQTGVGAEIRAAHLGRDHDFSNQAGK